MYTKIKTIENISYTKIQFIENIFYVVDQNSNSIQAYNLKSLKLQWETNNEDYTCIAVNKMVAGVNLQLYDLGGRQVYRNQTNKWYDLEFSSKENWLLYNTVDEDTDKVTYHLFDVKKYLFFKTGIEIKSFPLFFLNEEMLICKYNELKILHFNIIEAYNIKKGTIAWKKDLNQTYLGQAINITEVKEHQGGIVVVTTAGVVKLNIEDGSVIWKTSSYACTMEIVNNVGYVCTSGSLYKINLDTGEESGYGREYDKVPDFIYEGKNYWSDPYRVVYHDGLLWCSVYSSGHSFLLAINPDNGNYEWIHHVDTYEKTEAPQFYEDKMFLWDTGNTLHIYEKE